MAKISDSDGLVGKLEMVSPPREIRWTDPLTFLQLILKIFRVRFPVRQNQNLVMFGSETPGVDDRDKPWAQIDQQGNLIGWQVFTKGAYRTFSSPEPGEVRWFIGDSTKPPKGWQVIDDDVGGLNNAVVTKLKQNYVPNISIPGAYIYFACRYLG